jgi:hypothetical protein
MPSVVDSPIREDTMEDICGILNEEVDPKNKKLRMTLMKQFEKINSPESSRESDGRGKSTAARVTSPIGNRNTVDGKVRESKKYNSLMKDIITSRKSNKLPQPINSDPVDPPFIPPDDAVTEDYAETNYLNVNDTKPKS